MTPAAHAVREAMDESHSKLDSFLEGNKVRVIELVADVIEIATKPLLSDLEAKDKEMAELVVLLESVRPHLTGLPDPEHIEMFLNHIDAKLKELEHG